MRYGYEFRRKWHDASGAAMDVGKKLLGYLSNQRRLSGVETMVIRHTMEDGTTVEARFDKAIPSVRILSAEGQGMCELYVESGMLDLGPNMAADAGERFNRGPPVFDDRPATLYFGDGVDCSDTDAGLNGRIRLHNQNLSSECLPENGSGVQSRLRDPVKKQAQAMLPASCWSGLMQRYVQAVYGGDALAYSADGTTLTVEGMNVGGYGISVGLVEIGGEHIFVYAGSGPVSASRIRFKSKCGEAVYRMWQATRTRMQRSLSDKILTIALSEAYPASTPFVIGDVGDLQVVSLYGWQFSASTPEAHVVSIGNTNASLVKLAFSASESSYSATMTVVEAKPLAPWYSIPCIVVGPDGAPYTMEGTDNSEGLSFGESIDHPVHCYYDDDALVVVRYSVQTPEIVVEAQPGWECENQNLGHEGLYAGGPITWPLPLLDDPLNCKATASNPYGVMRFLGYNGYVMYIGRHRITSGLYASRAGGVLWSTVQSFDAHATLFYRNDGSESGTRVGSRWFFKSSWGVEVTTVSLGERFNRTATFQNEGPLYDLFDFSNQISGDSLGGFFASYSIDGENVCAEIQPPVGPPPCYSRFPFNSSPSCTAHEYWPPEDTSGHTIVGQPTATITCTWPCAIGHRFNYDGDLMLGPQSYLVIPSGNSTSTIAILVDQNGTRIGDQLREFNYLHGTRTYRNLIETGDCVGTATNTCTGWDGSSFTHAPHEMTVSEYAASNLPFFSSYGGLNIGNEPEQKTEWRTDRAHLVVRAVSASAGHAPSDASSEGQFERVVSGTPVPWMPAENPVTCHDLHAIVWGEYTLEPTRVDGVDGSTSIEEMLLDNPNRVFQNGFSYIFRASLLGAGTKWSEPLTFGASIAMDRETITGGYPKVNTPSFVGWA